jgi:hypothetical protein
MADSRFHLIRRLDFGGAVERAGNYITNTNGVNQATNVGGNAVNHATSVGGNVATQVTSAAGSAATQAVNGAENMIDGVAADVGFGVDFLGWMAVLNSRFTGLQQDQGTHLQLERRDEKVCRWLDHDGM